MSEILSQAEIDALLASLDESEGSVAAASKRKEPVSSKKIRVYDFKRPSKFSKEQLHTLQAMHENFARLLATNLSAHMRTVVQISVHSVEQVTYEEFIHSLPNPTIMNILQIEPLEGNALLEMNPSVAFAAIERLFGGEGQSPEKTRALTDIERAVIEKITNRSLGVLSEAWENIVKLKPRLEVIETNPAFTQIVSPSEMVVLISFLAKIGEVEGALNLCFPYLTLAPIIGKLSAHYWFAGTARETTAENIMALRQRIQKATVPLAVILGNATVNVNEFLGLQKGDVIQLESNLSEPLDIFVGNRKKYYGRPGLVGSKMAIQITSVFKEGDENE